MVLSSVMTIRPTQSTTRVSHRRSLTYAGSFRRARITGHLWSVFLAPVPGDRPGQSIRDVSVLIVGRGRRKSSFGFAIQGVACTPTRATKRRRRPPSPPARWPWWACPPGPMTRASPRAPDHGRPAPPPPARSRSRRPTARPPEPVRHGHARLDQRQRQAARSWPRSPRRSGATPPAPRPRSTTTAGGHRSHQSGHGQPQDASHRPAPRRAAAQASHWPVQLEVGPLAPLHHRDAHGQRSGLVAPGAAAPTAAAPPGSMARSRGCGRPSGRRRSR